LVRKASALIQNAAVTPMRYVYPLDPECPVVAEFMGTLFGDPTMAMGAPVEDITEEFERRHRKQCKRCQEYGLRQRRSSLQAYISALTGGQCPSIFSHD
jgi:hypothetical protein